MNTSNHEVKSSKFFAVATKSMPDEYRKSIFPPDPAFMTFHPSAYLIRTISAVNLVLGVRYMIWRFRFSIPTSALEFHQDSFFEYCVASYMLIYFVCEMVLITSIFMSHCTRLLPAIRPVVRMDELIAAESTLMAKRLFSPKHHKRLQWKKQAKTKKLDLKCVVAEESKVAIMVPTAGEGLEMLLHALLGCFSQSLWQTPANVSCKEQLRILVLDEQRRGELLVLCSDVYNICTCLYDIEQGLNKGKGKVTKEPSSPKSSEIAPISTILSCSASSDKIKEEQEIIDPFLKSLTMLEFWDLYKNFKIKYDFRAIFEGNQPKTIPNHVAESIKKCFILACKIDDLLITHSLPSDISTSGPVDDDALIVPKVEPGYIKVFDSLSEVPSFVYVTREKAGTPVISPKAGNLNYALFDIQLDTGKSLIGDASVVVINDARHCLLPNFLQRTVPYLFELRPDRLGYQKGKICFVQAPQRFQNDNIGDPLANWGCVKFNITNVGKDGAGGVTSCGQGSVWRVDALSGLRADGSSTVEPDEICNPDHPKRGQEFGFRTDTPIEDMVTSLELFKQGWRSAYILEPEEYLSICSLAPNSVQWRLRQVYRWHVGGVLTLFQKGLLFLLHPNSGEWPSFWHRIFLFNSLMYYFRAFGAMALMLMPIVYSFFGLFPFQVCNRDFLIYLAPFLVTACLPTIIAIGWKNTNPMRVFAEMRFFAASAFVEVFSILQCTLFQLQMLLLPSRTNHRISWSANVPVTPLPLLYIFEILSLILSLKHWIYDNDDRGLICALTATSSIILIWPIFRLLMVQAYEKLKLRLIKRGHKVALS